MLLLSLVFFGVVVGGGPSFETLVADLDAPDADARKRAVFFLREARRNDRAHLIEPLLFDADRSVRKTAIPN